MVGPTRPVFVLFGSSIVQLSYNNGGWGAMLTDIYARKADIILRGYNGWNTRFALQVLDQIFPKNAPIQPSLVIVYIGGNDAMHPHPSGLGPHVPLSEYIENMRSIAIHLKSLSEKTRIIFISCPPVNEGKLREASRIGVLVRTNEISRRYSEACIELCQEMDLKVIDLWTAITKRDDWMNACFILKTSWLNCGILILPRRSLGSRLLTGWGNQYWVIDGIHFSSEGSKIVVDEILKILKETEWDPCLHWKSLPTEFGQDSPYYPVAPNGKDTVNFSDWTHSRRISISKL